MRFRVVNAGLLALLLAGAPVAESKTADAAPILPTLAGSGYRRVSMEKTGANYCVRVSINGKRAALVVDTGSPFTTLDRNSVAAFGIKEQMTSMSLSSPIGKAREHVGMSNVSSIELANIVLANEGATIVDLSGMNRGQPIQVAGVFGLSHMFKLAAVIDCGHHALYLNPRGANSDSKARLNTLLISHGFVRVPMRENNARNPEVDCRINGLRSKIVVETAGFTTIIQKRVASQAGMQLVATGAKVVGAGNLAGTLSEGLAREFSVGNFQTLNQKLSAQEATFGILGIDYLTAHDAVIDFGGMNLYLHH